MGANTLPIYPNVLNISGVSFSNTDAAATIKDLVVAGANGSRIDGVAATSTETANDRAFDILVNDGGNNTYQVGTTLILRNVGTDAGITPAKSVLNAADLPWLDSSGSIFLKAGWKLQVRNQAQLASGKTINFTAFSGSY